MVLLLERLFPLGGKIKSVGLTLSTSSVQVAVELEGVSTSSSPALPFPFLLSLRRSLIPLALRFRTAGLRNKVELEVSR